MTSIANDRRPVSDAVLPLDGIGFHSMASRGEAPLM